MIEKIILNNRASFKGSHELTGFNKVNYIYGANGTGKTSISNLIANEESFPGCSLVWLNGRKLTPLVYNRDFIKRNFSNEIKGIFTLGEEDTEIESEIAQLSLMIGKYEEDFISNRNSLNGTENILGLRRELRQTETIFDDVCWAIKVTYEEFFREAYTGNMRSKSDFASKIKGIIEQKHTLPVHNVEILKENSKKYLKETPQKSNEIQKFNFIPLRTLQTHQILRRKIVGKEDILISDLIAKLENSDWVRQGQKYLTASEGGCPFCQQPLPHDFQRQLAEYFDDKFEAATRELHQVKEQYRQERIDLMGYLSALQSNAFIDQERIVSLAKNFELELSINYKLLEDKESNLGATFELKTLDAYFIEVDSLVDAANIKIRQHNSIVDDISRQKSLLKEHIWEYTASQIFDQYSIYKLKSNSLTLSIQSIESAQATLTESITLSRKRISELERRRSGIDSTISEINSMLMSFGFNSFKLDNAETAGRYRLIRENGLEAGDTLSEGEKTFITFLYFICLIKGSHSEDGHVDDRIVVFDDPISSLDSEVLFIVTDIIKRIVDENTTRNVNTNLKQFFILTHNAYFFKEVTFKPKQHASAFFIIRKNVNSSCCLKYDKNPIVSTYRLLWTELKESDNPVIIQNILRRILDNYFKYFGKKNYKEVVETFDGKDKIICNSLLSWVNDGSHHIFDDFNIACDEDTIEKYKSIFKELFQRLGQIEHYNMMMGLDGDSPEGIEVTQ